MIWNQYIQVFKYTFRNIFCLYFSLAYTVYEMNHVPFLVLCMFFLLLNTVGRSETVSVSVCLMKIKRLKTYFFNILLYTVKIFNNPRFRWQTIKIIGDTTSFIPLCNIQPSVVLSLDGKRGTELPSNHRPTLLICQKVDKKLYLALCPISFSLRLRIEWIQCNSMHSM